MTILPIESLLEDRLGIVGTSGSGKTYAAGVLIETIMSKKHRVVIIDPLGVWWGLRLRADGATPSTFNPVIFGGQHGDLPLTEHAGQIIGETVATASQSCIVDLSQLGTKAAERRFMLAFLTALYKGTENSPVHLIFDEADMWAPQVLLEKDGDSARLLGMMETVIRRGRVKGFVPWLITQRPAVLSKNVLSQIDGIIAMKLTSSQDRDAIGLWVEGQADRKQWRELYAALATMARGEGVVWVPARQIMKTSKFPEKVTFDSSRTPKRGEATTKVELNPIDLGALKEKLSRVETEVKASDPRALRDEIARLKAESRKNIVTGITQQNVNDAYVRGYMDGQQKGISEFKRIVAGWTFVSLMPDKLPEVPPIPPRGPTVEGRGIVSNKTAPPRTDGTLSPSARKILEVIHKAFPTGISFDAAARRAGISKKSSAYRTFKQQVITSGEVEGSDSRLVSVAGYGKSEPVPPGASVDAWVVRLPPSAGKMLRAIADGWRTKTDIAREAGVSPTSSGLNSGLKELVELELVEVNSGEYSLADGM